MAFICPQSAVDKLEKEKMPRKGGRWWFSWRRRDFPAEEVGGHSPRGQGRHRQELEFMRWMFFPQHSAQRDKATAREPRG